MGAQAKILNPNRSLLKQITSAGAGAADIITKSDKLQKEQERAQKQQRIGLKKAQQKEGLRLAEAESEVGRRRLQLSKAGQFGRQSLLGG